MKAVGKVIRKQGKNVKLLLSRRRMDSKTGRFFTTTKKINVALNPKIQSEVGDMVVFKSVAPISKTKRHLVVENVTVRK